ncbi:MAG: hypothetical protein JJE48_01095 [Actinobacteria bacterium]|nr:hypothetical protein [Actinomycetota bacterium]
MTRQWLLCDPEVVAIDANTAWAVGDGGLILRTADGGATWSKQSSGTEADLRGICLLDSKTALAVDGSGLVGDKKGVIIKTTDVGNTWALQKSGLKGGLVSVSASK